MAIAAHPSEALVAEVIPLLRVRSLGDRLFDYLIPAELQTLVQPGSVVAIRFGERDARGVVMRVKHRSSEGPDNLKPLAGVEPRGIPAELLALAEELAQTYIAPLESCLRLVVPPKPGTGKPRRTKGGRAGGSEGDEASADGAGESWPVLSAEQSTALSELKSDLVGAESATRLLWGVTGSGKTEVYLHLVREVLASGGGAILLVPEIALTPLMIERVRARFGDEVGVVHSALTPAQRRLEYSRIADGEARVVVGARSAVFAPVKDLRLIVVDESHDGSYKQEEAPGYHVKTVASARLRPRGGLLLEGSASPAVESLRDRTGCIRMLQRPRGSLPTCEVVDMRSRGGSGMLAGVTREALSETIRKGEQAIVLLNRRGYAGHVHCSTCGHVMMCSDCEVTLTYHSDTKRLVCHHCGRTYPQPTVCPSCRQAGLVRGGPGTERLVDELSRLVSTDRVFRLDSDVLTSGTRIQGILREFSTVFPSILVGTQMVAKGHDFPHVTLVVVADADTGLYTPDFRAAERTFQLLTQVSGRAGRAERAGRVVVQTSNPDVPCIQMALDHDDEAFYERELAARQCLGYPPYVQLIRLVTTGRQSQRVRLGAQHLAERLAPHFTKSELRGPMRLMTLRGDCRWHLVIASEDGERAKAVVKQAAARFSGPYRDRGVNLLVEVDPYSFV